MIIKCNYINIKFYYIIILLYAYFYLIIYHKKKPKISVFLPIYNKENYIINCVKNLQNQTFKDFEIVAINDYSNDTTLEKLSNLAKNDSRIKVISNDKNHGLLYSRAMGILNSSGEYLINLDPDDELKDNDSLEYLYNQIKISKVDIISFSVYNEKLNRIIKCKNDNIIQKQPKIFDSIFNKRKRIREYFIVNKLIKKEIFLKAYEDFKSEIYNVKWNYFEDDIWSILVNRYAKTKLCVNRLIYIYNYNKNSLMNKKYGKIEFQNLLYRHEMYKKLFKSKKDEKYLISEYYFLINRLKSNMKSLLLIKDKHIKDNIINIFQFFISNYKCSKKQRKSINIFLKLIKQM